MTENTLPVAAIPTPSTTAADDLPVVQVGYGVSLTDISAFDTAMAAAQGRQLQARPEVAPPSDAALVVTRPLEYINNEAAEISRVAQEVAASGKDLTPGEMIMLTVRSQEFMFHCQLTSNIANRTSDGLQQLFRQQS